jgi:hypothetical protein
MLKGLRKGSHRRKSSSRNGGDILHNDPEFGMVQSLPPANPSLGVSLAHLNRPKKVLSNNAVHALYGGRRRSEEDDDEVGEDEEGYALELYSDCGESVSSLNDSCFGGASVTGGYNLPRTSSPTKEATPSPLKQATSLVVGVVPTLAVSDYPSFDTEDVSVRVDLEQAVPSPSAPSGAMIPITGSLNIKRKDRSRNAISTAKMGSILDIPKPSSSASPIKILPPTESEVEVSVTSNESFPCDEDFKPIAITTTNPSRNTTTSTTDPPAPDESKKRSWCPMCVQRAPLWLKILLLMGVLLLLVATILVVLGLILEFHSSDSNQNSAVAAANRASDTLPTLAPTTMTLPADIFIKNLSPNPPITASPTASPTRKGRAKAAQVKTSTPTASPIETTTAPTLPVVLSYDPNTVLPAPSSASL